jgi:hypothetical protein
MSDWGQGAKNNNIGWGQGAVNNDISWGVVHADSWSGDTDIVGLDPIQSIINAFKTRVDLDGGTFEAESCLNTTLTDLNNDGLLDDASLIVTPNAQEASKLFSIVPTNGSGDLTVTRATTATYVGSDGLIKTAGVNEVIFDYSNGSCPSILVEPQRTNLALRSEEFENASWVKSFTSVTANSTTSPSGLNNADTFTADGLLNIHQVGQIISVTNAVNYSFSIYVKKGTNNFVQLLGSSMAFGSNVWANFDLNNGVVGSVGSSTTASIQSVGNGWYRCVITGSAILTTSAFMVVSLITSATSPRNEANTLSTSVYLWGAQFEAGSNATSYIPTTASAVTRNADVISKSGVSSLIGQTEGTIYAEFNTSNSDSSGNVRNIVSISDGTVSNRIEIYRFNNTIQYDNIVGGSIQFTGSVGNIASFNTTMKIALSYKLNSFKFFINGVLVNTDTTALVATCGQFSLGVSRAGSGQYNGLISEALLFKTQLTDSQVIQLTTL